MSLSILYYKSWNNWNPFSPRWGPPYPSRSPHLSCLKVWRKGGGDWFHQYFHQNSNTFYTRNILYPPLVPAYYFPLAHTLLSFEHAFTHNSHHYLFGRVIIDIIVYGRKRKTCIIFGRKNKWHYCLREWKLNTCLRISWNMRCFPVYK